MWNSIIKPTLVLVIICAVVTGSLAFVNDMTENIISQRTLEEQEQSRREVLSDADRFVEIELEGASDKIAGIYEGYRNDTSVGHVMDVVTKGYGGTMNLTVGVDVEGRVTHVIVGDNSETPGLGSKATEPEFLDQFNQTTVYDTISVVKQSKTAASEIQAISGATKSTRAIADGVQAALDTVKMITEGGN